MSMLKSKAAGRKIAKVAEDQSDDPFLIAMAERARAVQERFEERQTGTREALDELFAEMDDLEKVTAIVEQLFALLHKAYSIS